MDDVRSSILVLAFVDPHALESRKRSQDRPTDPDREFAFRRRMNIDFHIAGSQSMDLLLHSLAHLLEHSRPSSQDYIVVQIFAHIYITLHNAFKCELMDTIEVIISSKRRLEQQLRTLKCFRTHHDLPSIRQLVFFVGRRIILSHLHLVIEISSNVAHSFFNFSHYV